jgi:CheY-like chemotaxis protein
MGGGSTVPGRDYDVLRQCDGAPAERQTLIVEDDFTSRLLLQEILQQYGSAHVAVNGCEAFHGLCDACLVKPI